MSAPDLVLVGRIRRAHGLRGELLVEPITDAPDAIFASGRRVFGGTPDGTPLPGAPELHIEGVRETPQGWLLRLREIGDRTAAERWRSRSLLVPEDELEPPAEGEVFVHDLLGLRAATPAGEPLGTVVDVYELPHGLLLELERPGGARVLVPFAEEIVSAVDLDAGLVTMTPPEGLLD